MSSAFSYFVWTRSKARGSSLLVLLALADHADRNGEVQLSLRDIAGLCRLSKTRIEEITASLVKIGELRVLDGGGGRGNPKRYWIALRAVVANHPGMADAPADPDETGRYLSDPEQGAAPQIEETPSFVRGVEALSLKVEADEANSGTMAPTIQTKHDVNAARYGDGSEPRMVRPRPAMAGEGPAIPTQHDVNAVLHAAGIIAPPEQPLFWSRKEHRTDLLDIINRTGLTVEGLCDQVRGALDAGRSLDHQPRRLTSVLDLIGKGRRT